MSSFLVTRKEDKADAIHRRDRIHIAHENPIGLSKPFSIMRGRPPMYYARAPAMERCDELNSVCVAHPGAKIETGAAASTLLHWSDSICVLHRHAEIHNEGHIEISSKAALNMAEGSKLVVKKGGRLYICSELLLDKGSLFVVFPGLTHVLQTVIRVDAGAQVHIHQENCVRPLRMRPRKGDTWCDEEKLFICSLIRHFSTLLTPDVFEKYILAALVRRVCPMYGILMPPPAYRVPADICIKSPTF